MKDISTAFKTHLALPSQTVATCLLAVLRHLNTDSPPALVTYGFTDHDEAVSITGWTGDDAVLNGTYEADSGFTPKAIATSDALNVDNTEVEALLVSPSITEADLRAGLWDFATIYIFEVNYRDLTMGPIYKRVGWLGEVSAGRLSFRAELRGLMQLYTRSLVELTSPMCRAKLGDARCKVDLAGSPTYTFGAAVTDVNDDNQTFGAAALTQSGPTSGLAITNVSNANPGVVTMLDDSLHLVEGQPVTLSGIVGPSTLNTVTVAHNPSGNTFELGIDTSDTGLYPAYVSGGTVTPLGSGAGYFDFGIVTWRTGANEGLSMEVKAFVPGQVTLALPMSYEIQIGDTFDITAGCDKSLTTCRDKFHNVVNFRGEPYLPGTDKVVQVGRGV